MKKCSKCKEMKNENEFWKNKSMPDGYQTYCKTCHRGSVLKYENTEKGKQTRKSIQKRFDTSEKGREKQRRIRSGEKYKKSHLKANIRYRKNYPDKRKAHSAVYEAIKSGKLAKQSSLSCYICKAKKANHYHHHMGYYKENQLNVIPVCRKCHVEIENHSSIVSQT